MTASETVIAGMTAVLPPGMPLSFTSINRARFQGHGRNRKAIADVTMFDGLPARLAVWQWSLSWAHEWVALEGGDASFEEGRWIRISSLSTEGRS